MSAWKSPPGACRNCAMPPPMPQHGGGATLQLPPASSCGLSFLAWQTATMHAAVKQWKLTPAEVLWLPHHSALPHLALARQLAPPPHSPAWSLAPPQMPYLQPATPPDPGMSKLTEGDSAHSGKALFKDLSDKGSDMEKETSREFQVGHPGGPGGAGQGRAGQGRRGTA